MKRTILAVLVLSMTGCIPSLHPLYTESDLSFSEELIGEWVSEEGQQWTFNQGEDKSYKLAVYEKSGDMGLFSAHLLALGTNLFLDLFPYDGPDAEPLPDCNISEYFAIHVQPVHTFYRVRPAESGWHLAYLDPDWLEAFLKENPGAVGHVIMDGGRILLTGSTGELQTFVTRYVETPEAWAEWPVLTRKKECLVDPE